MIIFNELLYNKNKLMHHKYADNDSEINKKDAFGYIDNYVDPKTLPAVSTQYIYTPINNYIYDNVNILEQKNYDALIQ